MSTWSLGCHIRADKVAALFDEIDAGSKDRPEFTNAIEREKATAAVHAILWAYGSRPSDTAACYAFVNLWEALGVDMRSLKFLPASSPPPQG